MSVPSPSRGRWADTFGWIPHSRTLLWMIFVLVHLWLGFLNLTAPGLPLGDVTFVYKYWAEQAAISHYYVGINSVWVYPILALLPMGAASVFGFANYDATWLSLVFVLDIVAFAVMVGWRRPIRTTAIGWWWIAFLLLLGPIAMGRIDSITIPFAIVAVLFLASRPRVAAFLLVIGAWIKVWPAALLAAIVIASRDRFKVLGTAVATSIAIVIVALVLGSGGNVFSFVTQQTGRGLQVEAPVSSIWMWLSFIHVPGAFVYYDQNILTYQVGGPGSEIAATVMTPIFGVAVLAIAVVGVIAVRRRAPVTEVLPPLAVAFIAAFIAFNKVGSPQYITWLAVPVILGIATRASGHGRSFAVPAALVLMIAALTQTIYPYVYIDLLELNPLLLVILSVRNVLLFVLLFWALGRLRDAARRGAEHETIDEGEAWLPTVWPFHPLVDLGSESENESENENESEDEDDEAATTAAGTL